MAPPAVVVLAVCYASYLIWSGKPTLGERLGWGVRGEIARAAKELERLAERERFRAWSTPGPAARQAVWNLAKARFILVRTNPLHPNTAPTLALRDRLRRDLQRLLRAEAQSRTGFPHMVEEEGSRLRAYFSEIDCTLQPYSVSVPGAYDPAVRWPLIVSLHGHGWWRPFQGHPAPRYGGAFCVSPHGRGATDYMDLGELEVLRAVEEVRRDFSIDPDRIYIHGSSMGGTGSFHLGVHYADRFAGIAPIAGNADFRTWTSRWGWNHPFPGRHGKLRDWLQEAHTARAFAGNLLNLPTYVIHGGGDTVVPPEHARTTVAQMRELGCPVEYREFPGAGHGGFPGAAVQEALAWTCGQERSRYPRRVRWQANLLRHGKAYWVRLEQKARPGEFAGIDALAEDDSHVRIQADNLLMFSLERAPELFDLKKPLFVSVNGDRVIFPARTSGRQWLTLRYAEGRGWADTAVQPPAKGLRKGPGLEGPISEALRQPFVVVVGTAGKYSLTRELWWREAKWFMHEWRRRNGEGCPLIRDKDCTAYTAERRNLILLGGPSDNSVTAQLAGRLPLGQLAELVVGVSLESGSEHALSRLLRTPDVGLFTVYPNPFHPDRLVVVLAAGGPSAIYQSWKRFGNWFNWGVFDSKKFFDYAVYDSRTASPESYLLLGWYGPDWSIGKGIRYGPNARVRAQLAPQHFPPLTSFPEDAAAVDLGAMRPTVIDQMRGAVGFGRTYHGQPLVGGLGVRAPCVLEYAIGRRCTRFTSRARLAGDPCTAMCLPRRRGERVRFIVKGDGRLLTSGDVTWDQPLVALEADVTGVNVLRLETLVAGGPAWLHGGAAWLGPRLFR